MRKACSTNQHVDGVIAVTADANVHLSEALQNVVQLCASTGEWFTRL